MDGGGDGSKICICDEKMALCVTHINRMLEMVRREEGKFPEKPFNLRDLPAQESGERVGGEKRGVGREGRGIKERLTGTMGVSTGEGSSVSAQ